MSQTEHVKVLTLTYDPKAHPIHTSEEQEVAPDKEHCSLGHGKQTDAVVAATIVLYVPIAHAVQLVCPTDELYVPAKHDMQIVCPMDGLYIPAMQDVQTDSVVAPTAVL